MTRSSYLKVAEVNRMVTIDNDGLVTDVVDSPNIEPWFLIWCSTWTSARPDWVVITQDAKSFRGVAIYDHSLIKSSLTKEQFTAAERPIIKSAIKRYVDGITDMKDGS